MFLFIARAFLSERGHVDHEHLRRGQLDQGIHRVIVKVPDGANAAVDRFRSQVQVLADMPGVQIHIAIAALGIAPDGPVGDGSPDEGHRAGQDLPLPAAGLGQSALNSPSRRMGASLCSRAIYRYRPGSSPSTRLMER